MKFSSLFLKPPVKARHCKRTFVSSPDDEASQPTREIIELALNIVRSTLDVDISDISARMKTTPRWPDVWPGEHYKLLAGIVALLQPKVVIEIGTDTGLSAICLKKYLPKDSQLVTFDLIKWDQLPNTCLRQDDFSDGRFKQILADLANPEVFQQHADLLSRAQFFFIDGPKDKIFEPAFARNLDSLSFTSRPLMLFDDIRDLNMLQFWRDITRPKLDLSSFGHWTGTGLALWANNLKT